MLEILKERYDHVLTVSEIAELLRITPQTVYAQLARGDFPIPHGNIGKRYLFAITDVADFLTQGREATIKKDEDANQLSVD